MQIPTTQFRKCGSEKLVQFCRGTVQLHGPRKFIRFQHVSVSTKRHQLEKMPSLHRACPGSKLLAVGRGHYDTHINARTDSIQFSRPHTYCTVANRVSKKDHTVGWLLAVTSLAEQFNRQTQQAEQLHSDAELWLERGDPFDIDSSQKGSL